MIPRFIQPLAILMCTSNCPGRLIKISNSKKTSRYQITIIVFGFCKLNELLGPGCAAPLSLPENCPILFESRPVTLVEVPIPSH